MPEGQSGFRKGRSCIDNIFTVRQIIEKRREQSLKTHLLFVDYCKAFNKVPSSMLWGVLENRDIRLHLIQVIKSKYLGTRIEIKQRNPIKINGGDRQGCFLSTALFNIDVYKRQVL